MKFRRVTCFLALLAGLGLLAPLGGDADLAHAKRKSAKKTKVCKERRGKRRCRWQKEFDGHAVKTARLDDEPLSRPSGDIEVWPQHFAGEKYKVNIYAEDGSFDEAALAELDHAFRCRRTGNQRAVDPRLYEALSRIYEHFGRKPIVLVSGHRYQPNEKSRHFHASAMDIRIKGVSDRKLYKYASSLDRGGMGIGLYPRSGFVHVDFRAPGADSYRWTDWSGSEGGGEKRKRARRRKPVS